jgi:hypothetical protein
VRKQFVAGTVYRKLKFQVLDKSLVLLAGRAGYGRQHLGTHILDALCDSNVDYLDGGTLADLAIEDLAEDAGYLWTGLLRSGDLEVVHTERLAGGLRDRRACMIVIWPDDTVLPSELADYAFPLTEGPDLRQIVVAHRAQAPGPALDELLADQAVMSAVNRLTGAGDAGRLGRALREAVQAGRPIGEAVRPVESTAEWFGRLPHREDQAFAVSLAALDRLSFPTVVAGARRLDELIQQAATSGDCRRFFGRSNRSQRMPNSSPSSGASR